jgi:hypothetical protein
MKLEQSGKCIWIVWVSCANGASQYDWELDNIAWNVLESHAYFLFSPHFFFGTFSALIFPQHFDYF